MKTFALRSQKTGRVLRVASPDIEAFYHDHILGAVRHVRDRALTHAALARGVARISARVAIVGTVLSRLFNAHGELVDVRCGPNLVTTAGLGFVVDRLQGTPAVMDYLAVGTGTTAADAGDTTLETELTGGSNARVQGTLSQPTAATDRVVGTFAAGNGTGAVTEMGRLNASSTGTLLARQVFSVINKGASDSLQITHDLTVS